MGARPMTVRLARWSAEHPWRAIALWVVFVAVCFLGGNAAGLNEATDSDQAIGEAGRAGLIVSSGNFTDPATENVLITPRGGILDPAAARAAAEDATARLRTVPGVASVGTPVPSRDGDALLLPITMSGDPETASDRVQPLRDATAGVQDAHPGLRVEQVGGPSISKALDDTLGADFKRAELLSLPVTLAILIVAFGALIAAGVPVLLALSSVAAAMGLSTLASHLVPATDTTASVILLIGMAVGVDYSLFYVRREREERAKGRSGLDAVEIAAETSGHAVVVSGFAVIISMAGLLLAGDVVFSSLAVGSILVVAVAVIGSLTVLPAMLAKLGRWVDRPRVPLLWRLTAPRTGRHGRPVGPRFWPAVLRPALRAPAVTLVVSVGLLLALAAPALGMKLKFPGMEDLPRSTPAMQAYDRLTAAFPSSGTSHSVVVRAPAAEAGAVRAALTTLSTRAAGDPLFAPPEGDGPKIEQSADGRVSVLEVAIPYASRDARAVSSLERLRGDLVPAALRDIGGAEYAVGGEVAGSEDYAQHVRDKLPIVVGFVLVLTFLVMTWVFRSVVIALSSILLNLLSAGAAYGLLVLVFQGGSADDLLNFTSMDAIVSWLPLFLFVVLFGLSMDYHVFVVSRIREGIRAGMSNSEAVAYGITSSAGVVTSAAIVMVGVFSIFATLSTIDMKQLGIGLAAAILLDATIIRAVVLPSLMTLLGDANWWAPKFLRARPAATPTDPPAPTPELVGAH
ncbi:MMPL family transporter [Micromonospora endolithica]|uniref:MMPL family transporter n=1 Tax=Micromonospora endolithica TaxID=230091 RepID=A0A3A9ZMC4_9ACTN|nr:MMPL family transporter [Micromonospora endolithica]RKN49349.1 MMPL family transporter [Micromonospora endolithica]TWJ23536.1 RND superfamily putative drug exporter [Micromonospora endolithica]